MTMVEPGIFHPFNSAHLSLGTMFADLSPAGCACAELAATSGTLPKARQTISWTIAAHVADFILSSRVTTPLPTRLIGFIL